MNWYERLWAHSRFIRTLLQCFRDVWTLLHRISIASIFYLQKKKNAQRGLLSGSWAEYSPAGGDRLLLPPTVPLKSKGSWE